MNNWTKEQKEEFYALAKPITEFFEKNGHPHMTAIISQYDVRIDEALIGGSVEKLYEEEE